MATMKQVRGNRETKTYVYLKIGAEHLLGLASESKEGQAYTCVSVLVLSAFMLEAYFNHLGADRNKDWDKIERSLPKRQKFERFAVALGSDADLGKSPFSAVAKLFSFRDQMAHGKTLHDTVDVEVEVGKSIAQSIPSAEWLEFANLANATTLLKQAIEVIQRLHVAHGYERDPFMDAGGGAYVASSTKPISQETPSK